MPWYPQICAVQRPERKFASLGSRCRVILIPIYFTLVPDSALLAMSLTESLETRIIKSSVRLVHLSSNFKSRSSFMKYLKISSFSVVGALRWTGAALLSQWFLIAMGVLILLAYLFPNVGRHDGVLKSQYTIEYGVVAIVFLISGLSISSKTLARMALHWRAHVVTQSISLLITPTIFFGFAEAMRRANNPNIDPYILIGLIITGCTPTTVSSNVVMTRQADGNDSLALIEVSIGNILGAFITPALVQMYVSAGTGFSYGNPAKGSSMTALYGHVMKQLSLAVFLPLFVGQVIQNIWPKQVKHIFQKYYISKLGSVGLLLLIWATFSTAFHQNAFEVVPSESIIMVVFFNIGAFILFCGICIILARSPLSRHAAKSIEIHYQQSGANEKKTWKFYIYKFLAPFYFSRQDTIAIIFCGAAKTVVLGVPLINAQYIAHQEMIGRVSVPLVLYQGEQLLVSQLLIPLFRRWVGQEELQKAQQASDPECQQTIIVDDTKILEESKLPSVPHS